MDETAPEIVEGHREITTSTRKNCSECILECTLKKHRLSINDDAECICPVARKHAEEYNHPVIDKHVLLGLSAKTLKKYHGLASETSNPKVVKEYFDMQMKLKDAFFPEVQKSANINVQIDAARELIDKIIKS